MSVHDLLACYAQADANAAYCFGLLVAPAPGAHPPAEAQVVAHEAFRRAWAVVVHFHETGNIRPYDS